MIEDKVAELVSVGEKLKGDRSTHWDALFEECARYFLPNRTGFQSEQHAGQERRSETYTTVPELSQRSLSSAITQMLRPPGKTWFKAKAKNVELERMESVQAYMHVVTQITYEELYDPRVKAEQMLSEADADLITFGTTAVRMGWNPTEQHLLLRTRSLANVYYAKNYAGEIDQAYAFEELTLRQLEQQFGADKLTDEMKQALNDPKPDLAKKYTIVHCVVPDDDYKRIGFGRNKNGAMRFPFASLWVDVKSKKILQRGGFWDFPYIVAQWDTMTEEIYARSPAMTALPDARVSDMMSQDILDAGANVVRPPMAAWDDVVIGGVNLVSGHVTQLDGSKRAQLNNSDPIFPIVNGALPRETLEMLQIVDERIAQAFYRDILELPQQRDLTATEINARLDQYIRQAAPVFSRVENNYNAPLINRAFKILQRQGKYPDPPEELEGSDIEFEYESPIKAAREKAEALKIVEGISMIKSMAEGLPPQAAEQLAENFDVDTLARYSAMRLDLPPMIFLPLEKVAEDRQARAEQAEQMQKAEMAAKLAPAIGQAGNLMGKANEAGMLGSGEAPIQLTAEDAEGAIQSPEAQAAADAMGVGQEDDDYADFEEVA